MIERTISRRKFMAAAATAAAAQWQGARAWAMSADRYALFRELKFGMFIHWGPYSVAGVEASWPIMRPNGEISEAEYHALYTRFNPVNYDPQAWVDLARSAGQRYMVFTTKHADGFCMFDSDYTDYKITKTPYGKDVLRMLADACHEGGMRLGMYYSPPDMDHPDYRDTSKSAASNYRGEPHRPEWPVYLDYMRLQIDELLTRYGPVCDFWFDAVDWNVQHIYDGRRFVEQVRGLQPEIYINNRIGVPGDYITPEQFFPQYVPVRGDQLHAKRDAINAHAADAVPRLAEFQPWECCMTINSTWAYRLKDKNFKSIETLINTLVEVVSRGGNYLLDVGPQPDGRIQPEFAERLQGVGKWVGKNAAAIYGSTYGPVQGQAAYRTSSNGDRTYVFVMDRAAKSVELRGLGGSSHRAKQLSSGKAVRLSAADAGNVAGGRAGD